MRHFSVTGPLMVVPVRLVTATANSFEPAVMVPPLHTGSGITTRTGVPPTPNCW